MRTNSYSVRTAVLYVVLKAMWNSCRLRRAEMAAMRGIYTDAFIDASMAEIAAAETLPDDAARSKAHEELRVSLEGLAADCCSKWRYLKMYIRGCFAEDVREINYMSAGWNDYEGAAHQNWPSVISMMNQGMEFIVANEDRLKAGGLNMPDGFPNEYAETAALFSDALSQFTRARQLSEEGTAMKVEANNAIYRKTIEMGLDGQECFYNNDEVRKQFTFDAVVGLIAPAGPSGVVITVTNAETNQPLMAEVTDVRTDRRVEANAEGRAEMSNLSAGDTTFIITCDGFTQQVIDCTLRTGTTSRMEVKMVPTVFVGVEGSKETVESSK